MSETKSKPNRTSIEYLCQDRQYCNREILRIREMWGNKKMFTQKNIKAARWVLGWMLLYAPEDMRSIVEAHVRELGTREMMALFSGDLKVEEVL